MNVTNWLQLAVTLGVLFLAAPFLGRYLARVYEGERHLLSFLAPIERGVNRLLGVDPRKEMGWKEYLGSLLIINALGFLTVFALLMTQRWLPLNPQKVDNMSWHLALNTAVSFMTNTNWQNYAGEASVSYLSQVAGLAVQNFLSAATGMAVSLALIRGIRSRPQISLGGVVKRSSATFRLRAPPAPPSAGGQTTPHASLGNFWVDLNRSILYVLLPFSLLLAILLMSQGVVQSFSEYQTATTLEGREQLVPLGPAASQIAIKQLGTNGGGFFGANSAHPFENPTPFSNFLELLSILLIPVAFPFMYGRMVKAKVQGRAIFAAMTVLFALGLVAVLAVEYGAAGSPAGSMEGKEVRFGISASALWAQFTTAASNGSVNAMHDSFSALGGLVPLFNILLGEIIYGGVGAGLYGMLLFVILTVFIAGLMVGRTPEYLGKRIEAREVQMSVLAIIGQNLAILFFAAAALSAGVGLSSLANRGPHGISEILYLFASSVGNNGSAFAGLAGNTVFYNTAGAFAMLLGRFVVIVPVVVIAGSLAEKAPAPAGAGTFRTEGTTFVVLLVMSILIIAGLSFFPQLLLGPIVEHFLALRGAAF
jgi:K+-transporting ATPase ATPase A chain